MITERCFTVVGLGVSALCLVVAPASAASSLTADSSEATSVTSSATAASGVERASEKSDATLVGAAAASLVLGFGSATVAHRRRWRSTT